MRRLNRDVAAFAVVVRSERRHGRHVQANRRRTVQTGDVASVRVEVLLRQQRVGEAVLGDELSRHPLHQSMRVNRVAQEHAVRVRVGIDESRRDRETRSVELPLGRHPRQIADRADSITRNRDIGGEPRRSRSIDHRTAAQDQMSHRFSLLQEPCRSRPRPRFSRQYTPSARRFSSYRRPTFSFHSE